MNSLKMKASIKPLPKDGLPMKDLKIRSEKKKWKNYLIIFMHYLIFKKFNVFENINEEMKEYI